MGRGNLLARSGRVCALGAALTLMLGPRLSAQGFGARGEDQTQPARARSPRAIAPKDLTGYWESIVTEYWRLRMIVPDKSDYVTLPLNEEGRKVADAWGPAKDEAAGEACKGYGAAAIMEVPGRLHIYWQDDNTLRMDIDSGTQTRLLHFGGSASPNETPTWQGFSLASWEGLQPDSQRAGGGGPILDGTTAGTAGVVGPGPEKLGGVVPGHLKVVTTHMRPGYLQKNGVPYGGNATLEEYFDRFTDPYRNETWLVVTTVVTDSQYLAEPFITHAHFKKLPDNSGWDPTPCRASEAR
jgi:hypothetical protein